MNKLNSIVLLFVCFCFACSQTHEEEPKEYPTLSSIRVSEISDSGVTFTASLNQSTDLDITDHGFVWSTEPQTLFSSSDQLSLGAASGLSSFTSRLNTRLREGQQYYVRSFVEIDELKVLSDTVSFVSSGSQGPELISFSPEMAHHDNIITLRGHGFSSQIENNKVKFGDFEALILEASVDTIKVRVPEQLATEDSELTVEVTGHSSSYNGLFKLHRPSINGFDTRYVTFGDTVEIFTNSALPSEKSRVQIQLEYPDGNRILLNEEDINLSPLNFQVPLTLSSSVFKVVITYNGLETTSEQSIYLEQPIIYGVSKNEIKYLDTLRISGRGFSPILTNNKISLAGVSPQILELNIDINNGNEGFIDIIVPRDYSKAYSSRNFPVQVDVLGVISSSPTEVKIVNKWFRLKDSPFGSDNYSASLAYNDVGYVFADNMIWKYDPHNDSWSSITSSPAPPRSGNVFFALEGNIYLGLGLLKGTDQTHLKDLWKFSLDTQSWSRMEDFPGLNRSQAISFSYQGLGYVGGGVKEDPLNSHSLINIADFWSFDPSSSSWTKVSDRPLEGRKGGFAFTSSGLYIGLFEGVGPIYKYIPQTNTWIEVTRFPYYTQERLKSGFGFISTEPQIYIFNNSENAVHIFDTETNTWAGSISEKKPGSLIYPFTVNGKMYLHSRAFSSFWEFDPSQN